MLGTNNIKCCFLFASFNSHTHISLYSGMRIRANETTWAQLQKKNEFKGEQHKQNDETKVNIEKRSEILFKWNGCACDVRKACVHIKQHRLRHCLGLFWTIIRIDFCWMENYAVFVLHHNFRRWKSFYAR